MNKADRDLFMYGLGMGDLVQLHADPYKIDPDKEISTKVVVGYNYDEDVKYGWFSRGWHFKYIDSGALAVYMKRLPQKSNVYYWAQYHKIFCEGVICVVHEKYLYPNNWVYDPNVANAPSRGIKKTYSLWYSGSI